MGLTHFVTTTGIVKNTLGGSSLARIHVCTDTNVSVTFDRSLACHDINLGLLETEVRECLVGFCHAMHVFALLHCGALAVGRIKNLASQTLSHALLAALP